MKWYKLLIKRTLLTPLLLISTPVLLLFLWLFEVDFDEFYEDMLS